MKKGKMTTGYFWQVLNDNEIVFLFFKSREHRYAFDALGSTPEDGTVIVSDGYKRKDPLMLFLTDTDVPMDTNELERALRPIPLGRKNWLFCWTEVGAEHVGIFQSLIVTCRMNAIDPYPYLVDVLQRVADHPNTEIDKLTSRRWKDHFADNPLRSDLDTLAAGQ